MPGANQLVIPHIYAVLVVRAAPIVARIDATRCRCKSATHSARQQDRGEGSFG